jgi:hypothetical protein
MFKSRVTHGRNAHRGAVRRLGMETMEARLTLSATSLDLTQVFLQPPLLTLDVGQSNPAPVQPFWVATLAEGGFFSTSYSQSGHHFDGVVLPGTTLSNAVIQDMFSWSALDVANVGIQLRVIVPLDLKPNIVPTLGAETYPTQGGLIAIEPILEKVGPSGGSQTGSQVETTQRSGIAVESARAMNMTALSLDDSAISGEWARAMVFEITGGEPVGIERPAAGDSSKLSPTSDDAARPDADAPLSFNDAQRDTWRAIMVHRSGSRRSGDAASEVEAGAPPTNESIELTDAITERLDSFAFQNVAVNQSTAVPLAVTLPAFGLDANVEGLEMNASNLIGSVYAEAFEQLSVSEKHFSFSVATAAIAQFFARVTSARSSRPKRRVTESLGTMPAFGF